VREEHEDVSDAEVVEPVVVAAADHTVLVDVLAVAASHVVADQHFGAGAKLWDKVGLLAAEVVRGSLYHRQLTKFEEMRDFWDGQIAARVYCTSCLTPRTL